MYLIRKSMLSAFCFSSALLGASANSAQGATFTVLHTFAAYPTDGAAPLGGLVSDSSGNLYGTTSEGGGNYCPYYGCGTVFKITPDGSETIMHSFGSGPTDGTFPESALLIDNSGNLYGTTGSGGTCPETSGGCGTVFKIEPNGNETILHDFAGGTDGAFPESGVTMDATGNLYGTTTAGGSERCQKFNGGGCGTVYELAPDGTETVLYAFPNKRQGQQPVGNVVVDGKGRVYGITVRGGHYHDGILYMLTAKGSMHILHEFAGGSDGASPNLLFLDPHRTLFGATLGGGSGNGGTLYTVAPPGVETIFYNFTESGGVNPSGLIADPKHNIYGTAENGGPCCGAIFKLTPSSQETLLHTFETGSGGWGPTGSLVRDAHGTIYGTTDVGGAGCDNFGCGVVYSLSR
ncbi:MAG TPA: choice-of-anchor tandem repeat GloVer-containing protein [Rhizomicrobium sp.]